VEHLVAVFLQKRQTTEEERTTIGESNFVAISRPEDGLDPFNCAFAQPGSGRDTSRP
jgi:hypothetical protein